MIYFINHDLNTNKKVDLVFKKIRGLGESQGHLIANKLGYHKLARLGPNFYNKKAVVLRYLKRKRILIEQPLRNFIHASIANLRKINCYRGIRHAYSLPVRGQRTHSNHKTQKNLTRNLILFSPNNKKPIVARKSKVKKQPYVQGAQRLRELNALINAVVPR